jgi:phospholipid-transporting ATPase
MIQSANVGIGISGLEGMQAARASDYSIAQFRFLQRLLLVHGRWSYRRISRLILYSFYKNITLYLTQFWFCLFNAFSGQTLIDQWALALYNVWFTAFPIVFLAVLDRDIEPRRLLSTSQFPELYQDGIRKRMFNTKAFWMYVTNALFHSALAFFVPMLCLMGTPWMDIGTMGVLIYTVVLWIVTGKVALETLSWMTPNVVIVVVSMGVWYAFLGVYTNLYSWVTLATFSFWYGVADHALQNGVFWLVCLLSLVTALLRDFAYKYVRRNIIPDLAHVIQVMEVVRHGNFDRTDVLPEHRHLLCVLDTLEPKGEVELFVQTLDPTGFVFDQEGGQREYISIVTRAKKAGAPQAPWEASSFPTNEGTLQHPPREMDYIAEDV